MSLDVRGQSQHAVTLGRDVSIYSCSHVAEEGASAPHHVAVPLFEWDGGTFGCLPLSKTLSVRNKCLEKSVIASPASTVNYCVPPSNWAVAWKPINTVPPLCQNELSLSPGLGTLIFLHRIMLFWNHKNPASPMHLSLCNMCSCLWCNSAPYCEEPTIVIQYTPRRWTRSPPTCARTHARTHAHKWPPVVLLREPYSL